jgi:hypothetical protein
LGDAGYARGERCRDDHEGTAISVVGSHLVAGSLRYCVVHPSEEPSPRTANRVYVKFAALHVVLGISPARGPGSANALYGPG